MKKTTAKVLSVFLCLLTVISAFAAVPMGAESTGTSQTTSDSDVLWSVDFDDYAGTDLTAYLASKGINRNASQPGSLSIENGKLKNSNKVFFYDAKETDTFRDLFYGLYTDSEGNAVTDYYMNVDYTLVAPNTNYTNSYSTSEATVDGNTVKYTIYSPYRGESYFNPSIGGSAYGDWLFKVSSTGYLYTSDMQKDISFTTADGGNTYLDRFVYTKVVNGSTVENKQPLTQEVWETIKATYGDSLSHNFDKTCVSNNGYQLEVGVEYTIRIKFTVDSSKKVVATTYVRPADSDEPFTKVGSVDYKCNTLGEKAQAIRFSENHHAYTFDNIYFENDGECGGEHKFPVVMATATDEDGFSSYTKMNCLKCGAIYYTDCKADNVIESYDFTTMSSDDYAAFKKGGTYKTQSGTVELSENNGLAFTSTATGTDQGGPEIVFNLPKGDVNGKYKITFTTTITKLPCDQINEGTTTPGSSFFTDRTGNAFNILLRLGRNADYDTAKTDNEGWLKLRSPSLGTSWAKIDSAYTIKEGETYKFEVTLRPADSRFDLSINDSYVGTGAMVTSKWGAGITPYYRIGNMMQLNMTMKDYSFTEVVNAPDYTLVGGSNMKFTVNSGTMKFRNDPTYGTISENVREENSTVSSNIRIYDTYKLLKTTPYSFSFDFLMTSTGEFNDAISTDPALWSLVSWLNAGSDSVTKYGTMVRVGGIDNDGTKPGFEKFFIVMNNNGDYTDSEDNGNQGYTTSAGGEIAGYYSDKKAVYTFEAGEWVTFTLAVNPVINSAYLYANGELVGSATANAVDPNQIASDALTSSSIRIGDDYRKLHYDWAIKNIDIELTPDKPTEVKDSGTLVGMDFGKTYVVNQSLKATVGSSMHNAVSATETYKDSASENGYTHFVGLAGNYAAGATNLYNVSLTSQIGSGLYYNHLDNSKYAIETTFAFYDRVPTTAEYENLGEYNANLVANGKEEVSLPTTLSGKEVTVLRLSKYSDANRVFLLYHDKNGLKAATAGGSLALYTKDSNGEFVRPNAWYTESDLVNGKIPESVWVKAKAVVDETAGTFGVYVNDSIAYYLDGTTYKRAENLNYKIDITSSSFIKKYPDSPESIAWNENPSYTTIPRVHTVDGVAKAYGTSGLSLISYARFFQNCLDFSVRDVKITKLDNNDLTFVGTQIREESETPLAFDMRFVFATDNIYVDAIEYDVTVEVDGGGEGSVQTADCNTVYKTIKSDGGDINAWKYEEGDYFSIFNVNGIELGDENTEYTFRITPYAKKYNIVTGKVERDTENAEVTHVITVNGLGKMMNYKTETTEYSDIKTVYTEISKVPYKSLGRTQMLNGVLTADWSAAGIEFEATCLGDVRVNLTSTGTSKFTIVVDGTEYKDVTLSGGNNVIASNLPYGKHTFKIMNQSGYSGMVDIAGITIRGTFGDAPEYSSLLIEFIGDSITHGCGLGSPNYSAGTNDGTLTYAFLAAKELGADYTIMANGGMGVKWGGDYETTNKNRSMAKYPFLNDTRRGELAYEGYTRAADIVVIGLSTNDNYRFQLQHNTEKAAFLAENSEATDVELSEHMNTWKATKLAELGKELELLIAEIEANHGKNVPIILARGMMERTLEKDYPNADTEEEIAAANAAIDLYHTSVTYMTDLIENKWKGVYGEHVIKVAHLTPDRVGYEGHPTREGAAIQGADLAEFIKTEFPDLVPAN